METEPEIASNVELVNINNKAVIPGKENEMGTALSMLKNDIFMRNAGSVFAKFVWVS